MERAGLTTGVESGWRKGLLRRSRWPSSLLHELEGRGGAVVLSIVYHSCHNNELMLRRASVLDKPLERDVNVDFVLGGDAVAAHLAPRDLFEVAARVRFGRGETANRRWMSSSTESAVGRSFLLPSTRRGMLRRLGFITKSCNSFLETSMFSASAESTT